MLFRTLGMEQLWKEKKIGVTKIKKYLKKKCVFITCIHASLCYLLQYLSCNNFYIHILRYRFFVTTLIFEDKTRLSSLDWHLHNIKVIRSNIFFFLFDIKLVTFKICLLVDIDKLWYTLSHLFFIMHIMLGSANYFEDATDKHLYISSARFIISNVEAY